MHVTATCDNIQVVSRYPEAKHAIGIDVLRRYAVARTFPALTTLSRAISRLGFVQADPIRAPARAQDLILRHRVKDYRCGDLEKRYPKLAIEEDFFINYGFLPRAHQALLHPRTPRTPLTAAMQRRSQAILAFVRERGAAHPRQVDANFVHGKVTNYWGGTSSATTLLLEKMHYHGMLRVLRRDNGVRVYAATEDAPRRVDAVDVADPADAETYREHLDALVDVAVAKYAPLPASSLCALVSRLRHGVPQWRDDLKAALQRAKQRLGHARVDGIDWYWPATERPGSVHPIPDDQARLLAPFDPVVWDRRRFELLWGWAYRFEAYTPAAKRKFGYYAMPLLWRDKVVGWGNMSVKDGNLAGDFGYVTGSAPRERGFNRALDAERERMHLFLSL